MSKLDELIAELCPDGVVYKKLEEIATIDRGIRVVRSKLSKENGYPVFQNSLTPLGYYGKCNCPENIPFVISAGAAGDIGYSTTPIWAADDCLYIIGRNAIVENRYIYHVLLWKQSLLYSKVRKASIPRLSRTIIEDLIIPVPPLEVQREIVRVLDNFTLLSAELSAELKARKQQYEYYRNSLIFTENVPYVELRFVVKNSCAGATPKKGKKEYYEGGTIPWIRTQDVKFNEIYEVDSFITEEAVKETAAKWIPENCVIVAISGASAGRCAINKIKATTNQHCLNLEIDEMKAYYQYVYFCVSGMYQELLSRKQGARGDLNSSLILGITIPLPSLERQKEIIDSIKMFNTLINDISNGLPAEIEARQKQYEYYRDKLLTFKERYPVKETEL